MENSVKRADELREVQLGGLFDVFAKEPCMFEAMTAKAWISALMLDIT